MTTAYHRGYNAGYAKAQAEAKQEIHQLTQWIHDCQSGMYINCVYCGHRYGPADEVPATMQEALYEHIATCPKHPLSKAQAETAEGKQEIERLHSWDGLLELLDEHWPEDIFPRGDPKDESRDTGPRLLAAIRWIDERDATIAALQSERDDREEAALACWRVLYEATTGPVSDTQCTELSEHWPWLETAPEMNAGREMGE